MATVLQPAGLLKEGNALMNIGFALSSVGGAALAGLLIAEFGVATALLVDAASFLAIAILLRFTRGLPDAHVEREPFRERFSAGHALRAPEPQDPPAAGGQALALVLFTLVIPIEVIYAKESLGHVDAGFGILLASWGGGIVVGSLVYLLVQSALDARADRGLDRRDRHRLPRHGERRHAAARVRVLGRGRRRQRRAVDLGDDRAAGGDAGRLPGADRRPARIARRGDARRRLRDRRPLVAVWSPRTAYAVAGRRRARRSCSPRSLARPALRGRESEHHLATAATELPMPDAASRS